MATNDSEDIQTVHFCGNTHFFNLNIFHQLGLAVFPEYFDRRFYRDIEPQGNSMERQESSWNRKGTDKDDGLEHVQASRNLFHPHNTRHIQGY